MPQRIAVIGASADRSKFGNKGVRAYAHAGWKVYPVNPNEETIEDLSVFPSLAEAPGGLDRISIYLPPRVTTKLIPDLAAAGAGEVLFNPGSADGAVIEAATEAGFPFRQVCSIVDIGLSPSQFP